MARLPPELWVCILEELALAQAHRSLLQVALTSRVMASLALPLMYEHRDEPVLCREAERNLAWWRAIIRSTRRQTLYPYYSFVADLRWTSLATLLGSLHCYPALRLAFLLEIGLGQATSGPPGAGRVGVDAVIDRVSRLVAAALQTSSPWPRAPRLGRLVLYDDVMPRDLALAVHRCPKFKHLELELGGGPRMDAKLGEFLRALLPNSLESFESHDSIRRISQPTVKGAPSPRLGEHALRGLARHRLSLRVLGLDVMAGSALEWLPLLGRCPSLEALDLFLDWDEPPGSADPVPTPRESLTRWAQDLPALARLRVSSCLRVGQVVADMIEGLPVRLTVLDVHGFISYDDPDTLVQLFRGIAKQTTLETLEIRDYGRHRDSALSLVRMPPAVHQALAGAIASLPSLRTLRITMSPDHPPIFGIARSCLLIERLEVGFWGLIASKIWLEEIACLRFLKELVWDAESFFSARTLVRFITRLKQDPLGCHAGFSIRLERQNLQCRFSNDDEQALRTELAPLGGKMCIFYV